MDEIVTKVVLLQKSGLTDDQVLNCFTCISKQCKNIQATPNGIKVASSLINTMTVYLRSQNDALLNELLSFILLIPITVESKVPGPIYQFVNSLFKFGVVERKECHVQTVLAMKHCLTPRIATLELVQLILQSSVQSTPSPITRAEMFEILHIVSLLDTSILSSIAPTIHTVIAFYCPPSEPTPPEWIELRTLFFAVSQHSWDVSSLLSDTSSLGDEPPIRSRLTADTSQSSRNDSLDTPPLLQPIPSIAYLPWILLGVLVLSVISLVFIAAKPSNQAASIDFRRPNFDSVEPVVITPPTKATVPEGPILREEEDAFIIEDPSEDPFVEEMDVSFTPQTSEPTENEDSIVDLDETNSGSSLQGSMIAVFLISCCAALWYRFQRKPEVHEPIPFTPARQRSDPIPPMTTGLPPITPCPDSLEMNRRATSSFVF